MKLWLNAVVVCTLLVIAGGAAKLPGHAAAGIVLGVLSLGLVRFGWSGWAALTVLAFEFLPAHPIVHACLAPIFLAIIVRLRTEPKPIPRQSPAVFWLSAAAPLAILVQIALGAAYRHKAWSVLPHLAGAAIAICVTLVLSVFLLQNSPELRRIAMTLLTLVLGQVALGIASFLLRLLDLDLTIWFLVLSTAHVTMGVVLLATTVSLGRLVIGNPAAHR